MFITARAAALHMTAQGSGVILVFGGYGDPMTDHNLGGLQIAFAAPGAAPAQLGGQARPARDPRRDAPDRRHRGGAAEGVQGRARASSSRSRARRSSAAQQTLADVGNVAAFAASDRAASITAATVNVSAGALIDD